MDSKVEANGRSEGGVGVVTPPGLGALMAFRSRFAATAALVASFGWPLLDGGAGSVASEGVSMPLGAEGQPGRLSAEVPRQLATTRTQLAGQQNRLSAGPDVAGIAGPPHVVADPRWDPLTAGSDLESGHQFAGSAVGRQVLIEVARQAAELESLRRDREIQALTLAREKAERRLWTTGFGLAAMFTLAIGVGYHRETRNTRALAAAKRQVEELARTDVLTGLANRRHAMERLEDEARRARRGQSGFSVVVIDIDNFKLINDAYGHACGDRVLLRVADVLRSTARDLDVPSRWGGDEFLIVLPGTDRDGALTIAERVHSRLGEIEISWDGKPLQVTATFGIAACGDGDVDDCLLAADGALYRGKEAGRNTVIAA